MRLLPLTALVGLDGPRLALLLLAVEPGLRGVALAGPAGSGKSALMHGLRDLLPDPPFVEMPLGADDEALAGGLDVDATLRLGRRTLRPGLLARAHGGVLAVDGLNLLPEAAANTLLGALEDGELRIEREGLSLRMPARFRLVAAWDPAEGPPRAHLLDRIGLVVSMPAAGQPAARSEVVRRHLAPDTAAWSEELSLLRSLVDAARAALPAVHISTAMQRELSRAALALGVPGHRADLFAVMTARAAAALGLRDEVDREDVELAMRLVLLPRATQRPAPPPEAPDAAPAEEPSARPPPEEGAPAQGSDDTPRELQDEVLQAIAVDLPDVLDSLPFAAARRAASGSRGSTAATRGRQVGHLPTESPRGQRIDVLATLRAAARWQRLRPRTRRAVEIRASDLRIRRFRSKAGSLFLFAVDTSGSMALNRMREAKGAIHALLAQAYVNRDRVALMSFRGRDADLLLPPTGSVELLRRAVDQLPTGGGTPVAAALLGALQVAEQARRRGLQNVVLVLLTDGRANVGVRSERAGVDQELRAVAAGVTAARLHCLVVDTQRNFTSQGSAARLAQWLGGRYLYLPGASGGAIAAAAREATG
jgi:magnesium chelatase subunit D